MDKKQAAAINTELLFQQTVPLEARVSATGTNAAVRVMEFAADGTGMSSVAHVFAEINTESPSLRTSIMDVNALRWGPTGERLGFISSRDPDVRFGLQSQTSRAYAHVSMPDEFSNLQVWCVDFDAGGPPKQQTALSEPVTDFDWATDGQRLVVVTRSIVDPDVSQPELEAHDATIQCHDPDQSIDSQIRYQLHVVNPVDGTTTTLDGTTNTTNHHRYWYRQMSPRWVGNRIVYTASEVDNDVRNVYSIKPDGTDKTQHTDATGTALFPEVSPDGDYIGYVEYHGDRRFESADVCVVPTDTVDAEPTVLSSSLDRYVQYVEWRDANTLVGLVGTEGATHLYTFDVDGVVEPWYTPDRTIASVHRSGGERTFDVHRNSGRAVVIRNGPALVELATINSDGQTEHPIHQFNENIMSQCAIETHEVSFTALDGTLVDAFLYRPAEADGPLPTIVDLARSEHGYKTPRYRFRHQYWISRGYAILKINTRGSVSFGTEYAAALRGRYGELEVRDVAEGIEHAIDMEFVDAENVFGFGHAYGAVVILNLLAESDVLSAAVVQHGVYHPHAAYGNDDQTRFWRTLLGDPITDRSEYDRYAPITVTDQIDAPVLIVTGEEDSRSTPKQAHALHARLADNDTPVETVVYEGLGRTNIGPSDIAIDRLERTTAWYEDSSGFDEGVKSQTDGYL